MIGWCIFMIFTNIVKASKTTQPGAEFNRATDGKSLLVECTIFFTSNIIFALFYITIC